MCNECKAEIFEAFAGKDKQMATKKKTAKKSVTKKSTKKSK